MKWKSSYFVVLGLLLVFLFIDSNLFFHHFAKSHADSDQTLFWLYARDLSEGQFRTPFLYGQDYNIPLESILAAPGVYLGANPMALLPLIGLLMQLIPFLLLAHLAHKRKNYLSALLCLLTAILLPVEWSIMSMPRGFIGGIFLAAIAAYLLLRFQSRKSHILGYFLAGLALLVSPNAVILLLPALLVLLLNKAPKIGEALLAGIPLALCYIGLQWFINYHQPCLVHQSWNIEWTAGYFTQAMSHFPAFFKALFPIFYEMGVLILLLLVGIIILAIRTKNRVVLAASFILLLFILFSLGINKVNDGTASVFFPYSRMFLALPYACLLLIIYSEKKGYKPTARVLASIAFLAIAGFSVEQVLGSQRINRAMQTNSDVVQLFQNKSLQKDCESLQELLHDQNAELLVVLSKADQYVFGCDALNHLKTLHPNYERRWWLEQQYRPINLKEVVILDWNNEISQYLEPEAYLKIDSSWPAYKVVQSNLTVSIFFD